MFRSIFNLVIIGSTLPAVAPAPPSIVGHWLAGKSQTGNVWVDFKRDSTFKVFTAASTENEGRYKVDADTISLYDNNCGTTVAGRYLLNFYTEDSVSFTLIADPCKDRSGEVNGGRLKRLR